MLDGIEDHPKEKPFILFCLLLFLIAVDENKNFMQKSMALFERKMFPEESPPISGHYFAFSLRRIDNVKLEIIKQSIESFIHYKHEMGHT